MTSNTGSRILLTMKDLSWQQRIKDLEHEGLSLTEIGDRIGLRVSSVSDLKRGESLEPRGFAAVKLYELHKQIVGKKASGQKKAA